MSCYSKENLNRNDYNNVCKSHSARSDREIYRICPSKLSKRELEDLYFSLLENNLELKRTVNGQHDTIKGLSTKVQRMTTTQRLLQGKEFKDCCVGSKFVINEQRESITELRRANQKLSDKLQQLNMRLCSAKQFHRKSPSQASTSRCVRCATVTTGAPMMRRNNERSSETVPKLTTSMQCEDSPMSPNSVQTEDDLNNKGCSQLTCDENKCKTAMQELKMKIANLQEELNMVHEDYSARLTRLETEVLDVRRENVRVSGERTASLHQLETSLQKNGEVLAEYRTAEARCAELEAQLVVERRRVAELETQLKAANMSDKVNRTIEDRLSSINEDSRCRKCCYKELDVRVMESIAKNVVPTTATTATTNTTTTTNTTATTTATTTTTTATATTTAGDTAVSPRRLNEPTTKASDDSGYVESNRSQDTDELGIHKLNKQLLAKVLELQSEVASLRRAQESNMLENKKKLGETLPAPKTPNVTSASTRTERPTRVENIDYDRQVPLQNITQTSVKVDSTRSTKQKQYQETVEMSETNRHNRNYAAAVTQLPEDNKSNTWPDNVSVVTRYRPDTDSHTQTDTKLKVLKAGPLTLVSSTQNLQTGLNKTEMVEDKLKSTQATETNGPSKMQPVQDGFKFKDTAQQSEQSRAIEEKQADKLTADNRYLNASVSAAGSLASNPDIGVIMHSKLAKNNVRERGNAVKLYDGSETEYSNRLKLPMTEALVANQATTNEATEVSTPELCEQCAACTFDRECATRRRNTNDSGNMSIGKETKNEQVTKTDDHNSLQIPGPLPTDNYKERKRSIFSRFSIDKKKDKSKRNSKSDTVNSAAIAKNTTATTEGPIMLPDVPLIDQPGDDMRRNSYTSNKASNNIQRKWNSRDRRPSTGTKDQGGNILEEPNFRELMLSDRIMPPVGDGYKSEYENEPTKTETKEQASQATPDLRVQVQDELCTRRVSIFSEQQTYTVPNKTKRSASYDNTDLEMSYLSDLPLETDVTGKNLDKGRALSPGEDKTTTTATTYTESYCSPTTNYYSLSEGEVPTSTKRKVSYDNSYKDGRDDTTGAPRSEQSAAKMEAALRAIQDELARCKSLLQAQRPEVNSLLTPVSYDA